MQEEELQSFCALLLLLFIGGIPCYGWPVCAMTHSHILLSNCGYTVVCNLKRFSIKIVWECMILFPIRGKCAKWNCCCFWRRIFLNGWRKSINVEAKNGWKGEQGIFFLSLVSQWRVASVMIVMQWRPLPCVRGEKTLYGLLSWGDFYQIAFWLSSSQSLTIPYIAFWMPYWVKYSVQCFILHRDVKALKKRGGSFKSLQAGMEVESELLWILIEGWLLSWWFCPEGSSLV